MFIEWTISLLCANQSPNPISYSTRKEMSNYTHSWLGKSPLRIVLRLNEQGRWSFSFQKMSNWHAIQLTVNSAEENWLKQKFGSNF